MRGEKPLPRRFRVALRCRLDAGILDDRFDRVASEVTGQLLFEVTAIPKRHVVKKVSGIVLIRRSTRRR
jgi:hypothetical protein